MFCNVRYCIWYRMCRSVEGCVCLHHLPFYVPGEQFFVSYFFKFFFVFFVHHLTEIFGGVVGVQIPPNSTKNQISGKIRWEVHCLLRYFSSFY